MLRGFKITGANNFTTGSGEKSPIESDDIRKTPFFYTDGGGIKIYARSYPTIENVEVFGNYTSPCGAACRSSISGRCRTRRASAIASSATTARRRRDRRSICCTAAAPRSRTVSSSATSRTWAWTIVGLLTGGEYHPEHGSGALTVFEGSRATVSRCTFTGNWNGVDDSGTGSTYVDTIFWKNTLAGGISPGARYELDILDGAGVRGSFIPRRRQRSARHHQPRT